MSNKIYPKRGGVYTLREVEIVLELRDSAHLGFWHDLGAAWVCASCANDDDDCPYVHNHKVQCVIQTSHVTRDDLLSIPGFADSKWKYRYETDEWIPVFEFVGTDIQQFVNIVPSLCDYNLDRDPNSQWVTPKGFPRKQYEEE
jgi:hypothetical protein